MARVNGREVIAVTCNGWGSYWKFSSWTEAFQHPLIQYGDVICEGPESIHKCWNRIDMPNLLDVLVEPEIRAKILREIKIVGYPNWLTVLDKYRDFIWEKMNGQAAEPPTDPILIVALIVKDRKTPSKERPMAKEQKAAEATENTEATGEAGEAAEKPKTKRTPPVRDPKYKNEMIITLLADKDGNPYGPENNPKREGSASAARFALYQNGQSVEQALAAGLTRGDFDNDTAKKFISIK